MITDVFYLVSKITSVPERIHIVIEFKSYTESSLVCSISGNSHLKSDDE